MRYNKNKKIFTDKIKIYTDIIYAKLYFLNNSNKILPTYSK